MLWHGQGGSAIVRPALRDDPSASVPAGAGARPGRTLRPRPISIPLQEQEKTMRKLFWCCTAAGVVVAGGLYLAAHHACCHPGTVTGRCIAAASGVAAVFNPSGVAGPVAERVFRIWHAEGGSEESAT